MLTSISKLFTNYFWLICLKDKKEKYGRYLAIVYIKIDNIHIAGLNGIRIVGDYYCLNDILIEKGLAEKYMI